MYWLALSTLFWLHNYGNYPSKEACEAAASDVPFYVNATCIPLPVKATKPTEPESHKH
jgi:hypothetical protein